ncbi:PD-(D/E)XK nuclease family protein [Eudoraea chungangensis]|uniref:PD-(D/E)XK nuclease family protein n=1 Tax=Eudoraea chungangensis TaxID=1481905 RepID=UPI0023EE1EE3|nr:PD-(D/E)XK nuclease family protein [Eudoraea chungangensis]
MEEYEIFEKIKEYFEDNYELMRLEGGHALTEDVKQLALTQVLYYFTKLRDVATKVTDTEVKLTLPDQKTPKGRNFTIEGIVDIVRDENETWMYDIKTHDTAYIESNKDLYEKQLNVYAHIWQQLRGQVLDKTAVISTAYPRGLKEAHLLNDQFRIQYELSKWNPLIELDFDQAKVKEVVADFANTVDCIEEKKFKPASVETLKGNLEGTNSKFGQRICRECDARFSCASYREYATSKGKGERGSFRKYFDDFGSDTDKEDWVNANLAAKSPDDINPSEIR